MYATYWGLTEKPFAQGTDPRFLFFSKKHEEALVRLLYAINQAKGLSLLVGEPGTGKTFLARILRKELLDRGAQVHLVVQPDLEAADLVAEVASGFGVAVNGDSKGSLLRALCNSATARLAGGAENIVIVDHVDAIGDEATLREIALFPSYEDEGRLLFHTILIARPEFLPRLRTHRALDQMIGIRYQLPRLDLDETRLYILHRLARAGAAREIFEESAVDLVHRYSTGIPREISSICDLAMLAACGEGTETVGEDAVRAATLDYRGPEFLGDRGIDDRVDDVDRA